MGSAYRVARVTTKTSAGVPEKGPADKEELIRGKSIPVRWLAAGPGRSDRNRSRRRGRVRPLLGANDPHPGGPGGLSDVFVAAIGRHVPAASAGTHPFGAVGGPSRGVA